MTVNIYPHILRDGSASRDRAILDLLQLRDMGYAPGSVSVAQLRLMWGASQPQVSRRMSEINRLGIYVVRSGWGRYRLHDPDEIRAQRWESIKRRLQEAME